MAESADPRVAVYLDFDNIVMSWYDRVHGRQSYSRDRQKIAQDPAAPEIAEKLEAATVDVGAIIDYAASFGSLMLTRAYADWSAPVNAEYRDQLVARAVDLVQLFPAAAYAKNGADIRLAVDAVEDMFRIKGLTHVVIVAGDSDYVPLAQRCKRLGCHVVGVGVAGSTAKSLAAACDEFDSYETLPGVELPQRPGRGGGAGRKDAATASDRGDRASRAGADGSSAAGQSSGGNPPKAAAPNASGDPAGTVGVSAAPGVLGEASGTVGAPDASDAIPTVEADDASRSDAENAARRLLQRALQLGDRDDTEWLHSSAVKTYMRRMDPSFSEKALGYKNFSAFLTAHEDLVEMSEDGYERMVRAVEAD